MGVPWAEAPPPGDRPGEKRPQRDTKQPLTPQQLERERERDREREGREREKGEGREREEREGERERESEREREGGTQCARTSTGVLAMPPMLIRLGALPAPLTAVFATRP